MPRRLYSSSMKFSFTLLFFYSPPPLSNLSESPRAEAEKHTPRVDGQLIEKRWTDLKK